MGKALGLLPSWYWPEGVQRYLAAPRVAIYELAVGRWTRRYGNDPALATGDATLSFGDLDIRCARVAAALAARHPAAPPRVAISLRSGATFAPIFLGALRANATVLVLEAPNDGALAEFAPDLVVSDNPSVPGESANSLLEAEGLPATRPALSDATRPAIALPGRQGLAWHSHASLMSSAMAFAAFVDLTPTNRLIVVRPPGSWEGLIGLLAPLQVGAAAVAVDSDDRDGVAAVVREERPQFVWVDLPEVHRLLDSDDAMAPALSDIRPKVYVTVTGPFPRQLRRALRHRLRAHVLTVYGYPETGPIAAGHPSWYLDEAAGIPMVGVDLLALNPRTGQPSELPWPVLSYAGVGAKTQAVATNLRTTPTAESAEPDSSWYVTGDHGVLDANGMLFLLDL